MKQRNNDPLQHLILVLAIVVGLVLVSAIGAISIVEYPRWIAHEVMSK